MAPETLFAFTSAAHSQGMLFHNSAVTCVQGFANMQQPTQPPITCHRHDLDCYAYIVPSALLPV